MAVAVSIVDRTHRGRLALTGSRRPAAFLDGQLSNDIAALAPGSGCCAALLTPKGKMLADVRVLRTPTATSAGWRPSASRCRPCSTRCAAA